MAYSYKCYTDTKDIMKKYVNAEEGQVIYSIGRTRFIELAEIAGAIYKVGNSRLVNMEIFDKYLEQYKETERPLPKHIWNKIKESTDCTYN